MLVSNINQQLSSISNQVLYTTHEHTIHFLNQTACGSRSEMKWMGVTTGVREEGEDGKGRLSKERDWDTSCSTILHTWRISNGIHWSCDMYCRVHCAALAPNSHQHAKYLYIQTGTVHVSCTFTHTCTRHILYVSAHMHTHNCICTSPVPHTWDCIESSNSGLPP